MLCVTLKQLAERVPQGHGCLPPFSVCPHVTSSVVGIASTDRHLSVLIDLPAFSKCLIPNPLLVQTIVRVDATMSNPKTSDCTVSQTNTQPSCAIPALQHLQSPSILADTGQELSRDPYEQQPGTHRVSRRSASIGWRIQPLSDRHDRGGVDPLSAHSPRSALPATTITSSRISSVSTACREFTCVGRPSTSSSPCDTGSSSVSPVADKGSFWYNGLGPTQALGQHQEGGGL
jgi:hypothetical protein